MEINNKEMNTNNSNRPSAIRDREGNAFVRYLIICVMAALFIGIFVFLYLQSRPKAVQYASFEVQKRDIRRTAIVTGKIEPRDEVAVKPQISGIITELLKEAGQRVEAGEVIAKLKVIPDMPYRLANLEGHYSLEEEAKYVSAHYPSYPNLSMDKAALELSDNVYVAKCDFGWADIGTWHALYECMSKTENDNVVLGAELILENCRNNIISLPEDHIGVINGMEGYIIVEKNGVLLICPKEDSSALIKKYVNEVSIKYGEKFA